MKPKPAMPSTYRFDLSREPDDTLWDSFVARTPGGHHVQTSMWAQVKATLGWTSVRVVVRQGERIVGGAQMSMRLFLPGCVFGIVSKGPLLPQDPSLADFVVDALLGIAKEHHVDCLVIQPPNNDEPLTRSMSGKGFRPVSLEVAPTATIQIDLERDLNDILAAMKKQTRRDIRHGLRCGVRGREGTEDDLSTFYRLLNATSQRHNWPIYSERYYGEILRIFGRRGLAKIFFTEWKGQAVSSQLLIAFGDTVIAKSSGWSGQFKSLGPNNVLEWVSIQWAKSQGYRYYDLEGITPNIALLALRIGNHVRRDVKDRWCLYKLKYGGEVKLFPKAHILVINPVGNWLYRHLFSSLEKGPFVHRILDLMRVR